MTNSRKLLVLGIDAASPALLQQWAADGTMPTLAGLMADGVVAGVENGAGLYNGSAWPNFYTGLNPGEHGIYWIDRLIPGSYRTGPVTAEQFGARIALWDVISAAGHRVMVLDVPVCRLSPDLNGIQVLEWGTHDHIFGHQTTPPSLRQRIRERIGSHPLHGTCARLNRTPGEYREFTDQMIAGTRVRATLAADLLRDEEWDFAIQVFSEAHCAGHQLWHYHEAGHPAADPAVLAEQGDLLREVYAAVDAAIGRILDAVTPETTVVVVSLHGMAYLAGMSRLLPEVLVRLGAMTRPSDHPAAEASAAPGWRGMLRTAYKRLPGWVRLPVYHAREFIARRAIGQGDPINIDPARSYCFAVEIGPMVGGIRFNLRGREPAGTLAPGAEAMEFGERLTRKLVELVHPETGHPAVQRVVRTADVCHGPELHRLPDLLVEWDLSVPYGSTGAGNGLGAAVRVESPRIGLVESVNTDCRTGEHRVNGMLVARGPALAPQRLEQAVSVHDLAPTLARIMGCEMPHSDGSLVLELLR
jgi:predicted AlkP superfamily phosphohydrolase/phosphomutase